MAVRGSEVITGDKGSMQAWHGPKSVEMRSGKATRGHQWKERPVERFGGAPQERDAEFHAGC